MTSLAGDGVRKGERQRLGRAERHRGAAKSGVVRRNRGRSEDGWRRRRRLSKMGASFGRWAGVAGGGGTLPLPLPRATTRRHGVACRWPASNRRAGGAATTATVSSSRGVMRGISSRVAGSVCVRVCLDASQKKRAVAGGADAALLQSFDAGPSVELAWA
jgi:hypothetical protein